MIVVWPFFSDCLKSGVLYFINRQGRFPNLKFKTELLIKIMGQAQFVTTQMVTKLNWMSWVKIRNRLHQSF